MKAWTGLLQAGLVVAALGSVSAPAAEETSGFAPEAPKPGRTPADWERQASQWAVAEYQKALAKNPQEWARANQSLTTQAVSRLPEEIVKANESRGFVVFGRSYGRLIDKRVPPAAEETRLAALEVAAARGEWEPVQVGIWALRDLKEFSYSVSDLVSQDGQSKIGAADVRCLYGFHLLMRVPRRRERADGDIGGAQASQPGWEYREAPVVLVDVPSLDIPQQEARGLWIDVWVPKTAAAGVYQGQVRFAVEGKEAGSVPLQVTVYPFVLDEAPEWGRGPFTSKFRNRDELIQLREHGMNMMSWWTSAGYTLELKDGKIVTDFSPYQKYLKLLDELKFVGPHAVFLGGSDPKIENRIMELLGRGVISDARNKTAAKAFAEADLSPPFGEYLCEALRQFQAQMKAVGHGDLRACLLDEPDHEPRPQRRDYYIKVVAMVEKGAPDVPLYGTFYHEGDEDRLSHHHTVWCTNRPAARIAQVCRAAGRNLWTYHGGVGYSGAPDTVRFRIGMIPWVFGANGSYFWAMYWNTGDPFDPFWEGQKDYSTCGLPTPQGPLATVMLKCIREGVDDRRYVVTLEKLIAKGLASGDEAVKAEAGADRAFLDSFRQPLFEKMGVRGGQPNFETDNTGKPGVGRLVVKGLEGEEGVLDAKDPQTWAFSAFVRRDVARRIVSLQGKLK